MIPHFILAKNPLGKGPLGKLAKASMNTSPWG